MNHTIANGLEQERKKLEKDKQEASVALQQDRMKFEEERKSALLALEEGRRKLDEYKLQVSQQAVAHVKGDASVDEKDKGQVSLVVSSVQTADTRLGLVEKLIDIPKRTQAMGKSICENSEIVKKFIRPNASKIKKVLSAATTTSIITALRVEIGQLIGLPSGGSNGDSKVPFVNGTGNGASSTVAGAEAASTVAAAEAPSTVAAAEAPSTVAAAEAPSTVAAAEAPCTVAGAEAASTVAGAEAASTAAGGKAV
ncbi:uncharacterized protein LOC119343416 [Triticum dicoccoides]|uniref:uncharacterized protein LOC119343416 n=1 Tax=Triticum dicoccoides TaxID=85692 RepID=UPI00188F1063|nr:uncharacterized protein LOC119343416 [Triticum dicoccoides]